MSIFGRKTPVKGISKEEAEQRNYFEILGRHFGDMFKLNLLFVACNIIFIVAIVYFSLPYILNFSKMVQTLLREKASILPPWPFIPFIFMGPFIAGLTYVVRNWVSQRHAFLVSDFFEYTKKNWKQGLALSFLGTLVTYALIMAVIFYLRSGFSSSVIFLLAGIIGVLLFCMNFYTYPIAITFDLKLKDVLKNAWFLALAKLPQNLFFTAIIVGVHFLLIQYMTVLWMILMGLCLIVWSSYTMNYYVWHVINKNMISQIETEIDEEEPVFEDVRR